MKKRTIGKINNKLGPKNKDEPTACTHSTPHSALRHFLEASFILRVLSDYIMKILSDKKLLVVTFEYF